MSQHTDRLDNICHVPNITHVHNQTARHGETGYGICWFLILVLGLSFFYLPAAQAKSQTRYTSLTLRVELSPAQCSLNPKRSKLRQCREGYAISVSGLRPEPYLKSKRCSTKRATLPPLQAKVVSRIMPDQVIRDLAWQHYGSCMGMNTQSYFRMIAKLAGQLRVPKELSSGNNYVVNRALFEDQLELKNNGLDESHIQLLCKKAPDTKSQVLTELQVCYDSAGKFSRCEKKVKVSCPANFVIRGLP